MTAVDPRTAAADPTSSAVKGRTRGLVMLCDVSLDFPDATRTHTVEVARGFTRAGLEVDLIARGTDPALPGVRYAGAIGAEDEKLRRLMTVNRRAIRRLWELRKSADRFYVRDSWSCFPAILVARLLGYRVVLQVDGITYGSVTHDHSALRWVKQILAVVTGRMAAGQLAVTPEIKELLVSLAAVPEHRVEVIPNGVDLDFFRPIERIDAVVRRGLDPSERHIVFCGGFHPWSDFAGLLRAFSAVHAQRPDTRLVMVGDGPERARIEAVARELGLDDAVLITGMLADRSVVRDYLGAADVTVLVYQPDLVGRTSASPIKLTEYLAMGRAVVAIEIPGIRELVSDSGAGILVPDAATGMSDAILELLRDGRAEACGAAGRRLAEERLSWDGVIQRTLQLFER